MCYYALLLRKIKNEENNKRERRKKRNKKSKSNRIRNPQKSKLNQFCFVVVEDECFHFFNLFIGKK